MNLNDVGQESFVYSGERQSRKPLGSGVGQLRPAPLPSVRDRMINREL